MSFDRNRIVPRQQNAGRLAGLGVGLIVLIWLAAILLSLGLTATAIWAIIEIVQHFT